MTGLSRVSVSWIITMILILGIVLSFTLPEILRMTLGFVPDQERDWTVAIVVNLPIVAGLVYFLLKGGSFERKKFSLWSVLGILMLALGCVLPLVQRTY